MTEQEVQVGERLAVSYDITNRGQSDGEQTVELLVDGEVVDSEALVVDAGEKDRMSLVTDAFTDEDDGQLYEVEIVTDDRVAQVMTVEVIAIPDSGGTHQWNTDEGSGSLLNDAIGTLDGDINGPTWTTGEGTEDVYLDYNGVDQYVDLGDESRTAFKHFTENGEGTVFFWIKPSTISTSFIFGNTSGIDEDGMLFRCEDDGALRTSAYIDGNIVWSFVGDEDVYDTDIWQPIAVTADGSTIRIWHGKTITEVGSDSINTSDTSESDWSLNVNIGRETRNDDLHFSGGIDLGWTDSIARSQSELQNFVDESKQFYE